jgi:hypothetical protein
LPGFNRGTAPGGWSANQFRAAEIAQELGFEARFTYAAALFGFAATVPEARLDALRADLLFAVVEREEPVSLPDPS